MGVGVGVGVVVVVQKGRLDVVAAVVVEEVRGLRRWWWWWREEGWERLRMRALSIFVGVSVCVCGGV